MMVSPILRYWLYPACWRRWPVAARWGIAVSGCAISVWLATIPLRIWLPQKAWQGFDGYGAEMLYMLFLLLLSAALSCAGALIIAPERERQTWDSLFLSPVGIPAMIRAKLGCR